MVRRSCGVPSASICIVYIIRFRRSAFKGPLRKTLTSGLGLDDMSLAWPAVVQLLVFIYSGIQQN